MDSIKMKIGNSIYPFYFSENMDESVKILNEIRTDQFLVVYDKKLDKKKIVELRDKIRMKTKCSMIGLICEEKEKTFSTLNRIINIAYCKGVTNNSTFIAIGGGVLGNIVGLAASVLYRGIKLVHIPTTVIAAADSTISLKQAVNSKKCKNGIGTYFAPYCVLVEYTFFETLPQYEYRSGVVETVKNLLCITPECIHEFSEVMQNGLQYSWEELCYLVKSSIHAKKRVLQEDRYERKEGIVLEYGHTTGHAIEMYSQGSISHGHGVAFGMLVAAQIGVSKNMLSEKVLKQHWNLLELINVTKDLRKLEIPNGKSLLECIHCDNKRGYLAERKGYSPFLILEDFAKFYNTDGKKLMYVSDACVEQAIEIIKKQFAL